MSSASSRFGNAQCNTLGKPVVHSTSESTITAGQSNKTNLTIRLPDISTYPASIERDSGLPIYRPAIPKTLTNVKYRLHIRTCICILQIDINWSLAFQLLIPTSSIFPFFSTLFYSLYMLPGKRRLNLGFCSFAHSDLICILYKWALGLQINFRHTFDVICGTLSSHCSYCYAEHHFGRSGLRLPPDEGFITPHSAAIYLSTFIVPYYYSYHII